MTRIHRHARRTLTVLMVSTAMVVASAQTRIVPPKNKYAPADDVKLGQEAAAQVRQQLPLVDDRQLDDWVERVGRRLVDAIPSQFQQPAFRYTFDEVNQKEINAFALPGGPMFLNRGMIEAAHSEGEVAGVMAHELSHVFLRHGTAQATKGERFQIGAVAGQVLGAIIGGTAGSVIAQGSQFGLGAYFMKFSREYERQADLMGAQLLARAGYDPREMATLFKTLEAEGGNSGPEWLSDHPNPGNRYDAIIREAQTLTIANRQPATGEFQSMQSRLKGMKPAYTAEQIAQMQKSGRVQDSPTGTSGRTVQVSAPSTQYRTYQAGNLLRVSVPSNWQPYGSGNTVTYAPEGAYFQQQNGGSAFTHGMEVGVTQGTGDLARDTQQLLRSFAQSNPQLRQQGSARRENVGGRQGITAVLTNVSEVTGQPEQIELSTAQLRDNSLLYVIGVAPRTDADVYQGTFRRVRQGMQINDR